MVKLTILIAVLAFALTSVHAQQTEKANETSNKPAEESSATAEPTPEIWLQIAGGRKFQVDEVTEDNEGYWYKRGNIWTFVDRNRVTVVRQTPVRKSLETNDAYTPERRWKISDAKRVEAFFLEQFGRPLPLGSFGQSELHTLWGLDHRNGMDVSLHPDSVEGRLLIKFLRSEGIPFLAFRAPIPRVATGPHIHIGNPSPRVRLQHHAR